MIFESIPPARKRIYIVGVRLDGSVTNKSPQEFFEDIGALLEVMKTPHLSVKEVLLPEDSADLQSELLRRLAFRKEQDEKSEAIKDRKPSQRLHYTTHTFRSHSFLTNKFLLIFWDDIMIGTSCK